MDPEFRVFLICIAGGLVAALFVLAMQAISDRIRDRAMERDLEERLHLFREGLVEPASPKGEESPSESPHKRWNTRSEEEEE